MNADIDIDRQLAAHISPGEYLPDHDTLVAWVARVLEELCYEQPVQMSIRIVDEQEITGLNAAYRKKNQPTNVLSFPYEPLPGVNVPLLGDIVICAVVVARQAQQQGKTLQQHWAHMVVHGLLHLLGYDHVKQADAEEMEMLEINILSQLGFPNPYDGDNDTL